MRDTADLDLRSLALSSFLDTSASMRTLSYSVCRILTNPCLLLPGICENESALTFVSDATSPRVKQTAPSPHACKHAPLRSQVEKGAASPRP